MDIHALQLQSLFSLGPNMLGYCGKGTAGQKFTSCILKEDCHGVEEELTKFVVLYSYLKTLAQITARPIFTYPVIESYWLGNDELHKAKPGDYDLLCDNFLAQGVPDFLIDDLRKRRPRVFIPFHLFQVLCIGDLETSGKTTPDITAINNCMVRWGKVIALDKNAAEVRLHTLKRVNNSYELIISEQQIPFSTKFIPKLKTGDCVAVHWNSIVKILTGAEEKNLNFWTEKTLGSLFSGPMNDSFLNQKKKKVKQKSHNTG